MCKVHLIHWANAMFRRLLAIDRISQPVINRRCWWDIARGGRWPYGISAAVHVTGLAVLACVVVTLPRPAELSGVLSDWTEARLPQELDQAQLPVAMLPSPGGATGSVEEVPVAAVEPPLSELEIEPVSLSPPDLDPLLPTAREMARASTGLTATGGRGFGSGVGNGFGDGRGDGSGIAFFDAQTTGTRFVYVLDSSGSMQEPHREARNRFERLKIELIHSIGGLPEQAEFFVIFFNRNAIPMPATGLQRATYANKKKYLKWAAKIPGGGGTDPREALQQALDLRPDVIYFLTDGSFDHKVSDEVTKRNTGGVAIHTFCLGDSVGESVLREISRRNGGEYRFVP